FLGGCLDGRAGFSWCMLQAFYEYLILLKVWELRNEQPIAPAASPVQPSDQPAPSKAASKAA
ncbi:MAG: glycosyltransferase family 2 protein, partial [Cyanobacteria bacterium J06648_10]